MGIKYGDLLCESSVRIYCDDLVRGFSVGIRCGDLRENLVWGLSLGI